MPDNSKYVWGMLVLRALPDIAWIELVFSVSALELGEVLVQMTEEQCRAIGVRLVSLRSLPTPRLVAWYKKMGYVHVHTQ